MRAAYILSKVLFVMQISIGMLRKIKSQSLKMTADMLKSLNTFALTQLQLMQLANLNNCNINNRSMTNVWKNTSSLTTNLAMKNSVSSTA